MALFGRRLPREVRDELDLERDERVLAWAALADGWAVATTHRLRARRADGLLARPWTDVAGARLDPEAGELSVAWVDGDPQTRLPLADDQARFATTVRQSVESSILATETVHVRGAVVRVVLRRTGFGEPFSQVIGPAGVDLQDPATASAVGAAEARVREVAGLL